jgi:hypothetical protein
MKINRPKWKIKRELCYSEKGKDYYCRGYYIYHTLGNWAVRETMHIDKDGAKTKHIKLSVIYNGIEVGHFLESLTVQKWRLSRCKYQIEVAEGYHKRKEPNQ